MEEFQHSVDTTESIENSITNSLIDNNRTNKIFTSSKYYILFLCFIIIFIIFIICLVLIICIRHSFITVN